MKSLLFQCFSLCLHFVKFHHEMNVLKIVLYKISYPQDFVDKRVTEFLDRILMLKIVVSTVHKKDFMTVQPYLSKRSLQFLTKINCVMKNKPPYCNFWIVFQTRCKFIIFAHSKIKFLFSYILALFINLSAMVAMLSIMAKLSIILKSEWVNNL